MKKVENIRFYLLWFDSCVICTSRGLTKPCIYKCTLIFIWGTLNESVIELWMILKKTIMSCAIFTMFSNFRSDIIQAHIVLNKIFIIFNRHYGTRYRALRKYSKNVLLFFIIFQSYAHVRLLLQSTAKRLESYINQYTLCTVSFTHT